MTETPQVINTLRTKANQREAFIAKAERGIDRARKDLARSCHHDTV